VATRGAVPDSERSRNGPPLRFGACNKTLGTVVRFFWRLFFHWIQ